MNAPKHIVADWRNNKSPEEISDMLQAQTIIYDPKKRELQIKTPEEGRADKFNIYIIPDEYNISEYFRSRGLTRENVDWFKQEHLLHNKPITINDIQNTHFWSLRGASLVKITPRACWYRQASGGLVAMSRNAMSLKQLVDAVGGEMSKLFIGKPTMEYMIEHDPNLKILVDRHGAESNVVKDYIEHPDWRDALMKREREFVASKPEVEEDEDGNKEIKIKLPEDADDKEYKVKVKVKPASKKISALDDTGIYIVRHCKTALNNPDPMKDKIRGWQDIPLDALGKQQARELAEEFSELKPDVIMTSDLSRAVETAEAIAEATNTKNVILNKEFRPWSLGKMEGEVTGEVLDEMEDYIKNKPDNPVDGGEESFNDFFHRVIDALNNVKKEIDDGKYKTVIIVTHYRDLKLLEAWVAAGSKEYEIDVDVFTSNDAEPGSVFYCYKGKNGWELDKEFQPKQKNKKSCLKVGVADV